MKHELSGLSSCGLRHVFKCKQSIFGGLKPAWWISPDSQKLYKDFSKVYTFKSLHINHIMYEWWATCSFCHKETHTTNNDLKSSPYCWWKHSCTSWYGKYPISVNALYIPGVDRRMSEPSTIWGIPHHRGVELSCLTMIRYAHFSLSQLDPEIWNKSLKVIFPTKKNM